MSDDLQRLLDERACERLITEYTHLVDFGNAPGIADLFTADGVWRTDEFSMDGQEGIRAGFSRRQAVTRRQSRHVCTNIAVTVDGDTASGTLLPGELPTRLRNRRRRDASTSRRPKVCRRVPRHVCANG